MLRRKNLERVYINTHGNQSPYRFERKNSELSPMRNRTPTRRNASPFRGTLENHKDQSPLKFVSSKTGKSTTKIILYAQNSPNHVSQKNEKYSTSTNNDYLIKVDSFFQNDNNSKIKNPQQNSDKTPHENNKLFSKLVQKLNSQKKKSSGPIIQNYQTQTYKLQSNAQGGFKMPETGKLTRQKSQIEVSKVQRIYDNIKPVESVVYEHFQKNYAKHKFKTNDHEKQNQQYYHEAKYKLKEVSPSETKKNKKEKIQQKHQKWVNAKIKPEKQALTRESPQKMKSKSHRKGLKNLLKYQTNQSARTAKIIEQSKINFDKMNDSTCFDDLQMYLDIIKNEQFHVQAKFEESQNSKFGINDISMSINMDPLI